MSLPVPLDCDSGTDIPPADRLRELVTEEHHVVLRFPVELPPFVKTDLRQRLAAALPEFTVFDSGGSQNATWITVKRVVAASDVRANEAVFVAALHLFRQTAFTLANRLARRLGVPADRLLEFAWRRERTNWSDRLRALLGRRLRGNRLDQHWTYCLHGTECRFENQSSGQVVEVRLGFGTEFGVLDPSFFTQFVKSTPSLTHLARFLRDDFHDAARLLQLLHRAGHLRVVAGRFGSGLAVRDESVAAASLRSDIRTEDDWTRCADPAQMVLFLADSGRVNSRKLRLFACACVRRIWHLLPDKHSRKALETAERLAEGRLNSGAWVGVPGSPGGGSAGKSLAVMRAADAVQEVFTEQAEDAALRASQYAERAAQYAAIDADSTAKSDDWQRLWREVETVEESAQVRLLHDLFGNPFRPVVLNPDWMTWKEGLVVRLAQAVYEERHLPTGRLDDVRLFVLADALEESGCDNEAILSHLRQQEEVHVRGCWAIDLLLKQA